MNVKFILIITFLGYVISSIAQHETEASWIENNLKDHVIVEGKEKVYTINEKMKAANIPGASIAIVREGKIAIARGYGVANANTGTKVDTNTLFQAGSISKPIAALAILKLLEEGKVDLDEDVNSYLKPWKVQENEFTKTEKVTLRRLLNHTAGINVHGFPGYSVSDRLPSTEGVLNGKGNTPKIKVVSTPGMIWDYSGGGYTIMQKIVEDVTGMPIGVYVKKNIFPEIGMIHSTFSHPIEESRKDLASAAYHRNGKIYKGEWKNYPETAAAGLWTTPLDLARYCMYIQNLNTEKTEGFLSTSIIEQLLTPGKNNWGLGVALSGTGDSLCFGHGGKNAGFTNDFTAFAFKGDAIIIMTNGDNGNALINAVKRAASVFYDWNITSNYIYVNPISLKKASLAMYTGDFSLEMGENLVALKSSVKKGQLILESKKLRGTVRLTPIAEHSFIDLERGFQVDFILNEKGQVTGLIMNKDMQAKKN